MSKSELRRQERHTFRCKVRLHWQEENGREVIAAGHMSDLSESGMCIIMPNRVAVRTYVQVKADKYPNLSGTACVRFCVRKGMDYAVGLEFGGGAKLRVPGSD